MNVKKYLIIIFIFANIFYKNIANAELISKQKDEIWKCAKMYVGMKDSCALENIFNKDHKDSCDAESKEGYINCLSRSIEI